MNSSERTAKAKNVALETGKPYKGQIEKWFTLGNCVMGELEGEDIRISRIRVLGVSEGYVETFNSVYALGERA